jgi:hypothetical protein
MSNKERRLLSIRLGKTRRNSIWIRERRELSHPFSETVLKDCHLLESPGRLKPKVGGKMPKQPPMECWGCKGNHRYRYFPHRNDKVRDVLNVQQAETVEDMGSGIPRIYASLDNKQAKY